ncbi:MAG: hypothetical protein NVSMB39_6970 [Candidatus Saccharimonadales bacterium]
MKKLLLLLFFLLIPFVPTGARAEVPGLQVNPLQYEERLTTDQVKLGYIDVANPSDTSISIQSKVQAFRQQGSQGQLQFFDDAQIAGGINVDLPKFDLGPREAVRVAFSVNPAKLPRGGVYAAIFFRTIPPAQSSNSTYVTESANIGTLLMFENGNGGTRVGRIEHLDLPFFQFGSSLSGRVTYLNTDRSRTAVGFRPNLTARVLPWGQSPKIDTGLVLPGSRRDFVVERSGAYFGLLPLTVTDAQSGLHRTAWTLAVTGWYRWLLPVLALGLLPIKLLRPSWWTHRRKRPVVRRSLDGLAPRK